MPTLTSKGEWNASKFAKAAVGFLALTSFTEIAFARLVVPESKLSVPSGMGSPGPLINSTAPNLPKGLTNVLNGLDNEATVQGQATRKLLFTCNTFVANDCGHALRASTSYHFFGGPDSSKFKDRHIASGAVNHDEYTCPLGPDIGGQVELWLKVEEANLGNTLLVPPDHSVVAKDHPDKLGCDIFLSTYGKIHDPEGGGILTVYSFT